MRSELSLSRFAKRFAIHGLVLGLVVGLGLLPAGLAVASEGEHQRSHCHYEHATTTYRYVLQAVGGQMPVETNTFLWMNTGRNQWNGSGAAPTSFSSAGETLTPQRFRVYRIDDADDGVIAAWGSAGCPFAGNWTDESYLLWNQAKYGPYTLDELRNVAVHELGHALGLAHSSTTCVGGLPVNVMAGGAVSYSCNNSYGPYARDLSAASRIANPALFHWRNSLTTGVGLFIPWQTEDDDRIFRGRPAGSSDGPGTYDDDKHMEPGLSNSFVYVAGGGVGGQSAVRSNFQVGSSYEKPGYLIAGNFSGSGSDGIASFTGGQWRISQTYGGAPGSLFWFGDVGDIPLMGDWDGNGTDTVGVFRPSTGQWFLRNSNTSGPVNIGPFYFGNPGDSPVFGNWDTADAAHEIGMVRGRTWYLRASLSAGPASVQFDYPTSGSTSGMQPLLGDWDGDGDETPAYHK